jgi:hypothetical protein
MQTRQDFRWWKKDSGEAHKTVFEHLRYLDMDQGYKLENNKRHARLYSNSEYNSLFGVQTTQLNANASPRITFNLVQSAIDTITSKLIKNSPKITFMTEQGKWDLQQKAKGLTKFCEGLFSHMGIYEKAAMVVKDACIFGTGAMKFFIDNGEVKCQRVMTPEIMVDDMDGYYGEPRNLYQIKFITRTLAKEMFPDFADEIEQVRDRDSLCYVDLLDRQDIVSICEAWHLEKDEDGTNCGRHVICIGNATLVDEDYLEDWFPFAFFRWNYKPCGFFGQGIAEQGAGIQYEINKLLKTIQVSMHLVSIPKTFVNHGSKIIKQQLNNSIGDVITYSGQKPECHPLGVIPPELFAHVDRLVQRFYEIIGISQLSAQSKKPSGWDASAKALREFNDIESERFLEVGKRYEKFFLDAASICIGLVKRAHEEDKDGFKVKFKGAQFIETVNWKEVDMDEDQYVMSMFPTSALSSSPSGRIADVSEYIQAGWLTKEEGMKLLDFPDLKSVTDLYTAGEEDINRTMSLMLKNGQYLPPEENQDLERGIKLMNAHYLLIKNQDAPEEKLELLRRWVAEAANMLSMTMGQGNPSGEASPAPQGAQTEQGVPTPQPPQQGAPQ